MSYEKHLRLLRRQLELQAIKLLNHFNEHFPAEIITTMPQGGYSLWTQLESGRDMILFYKACEKLGVNFTPGHTFSFTDTYNHFFRTIFFSKLTSESFDAIEKVGVLMKKQLY